jgi:hypothetical protein
MCGALRLSEAGKKATLMGWVNRRHDLGNIIFVDLRDRTGVTQVVLNRVNAAHDKANAVRNEYVIAVTGTAKIAGIRDIRKEVIPGAALARLDLQRWLFRSRFQHHGVPLIPGNGPIKRLQLRGTLNGNRQLF